MNTAQGGGRRPLVSAAEGRSFRRSKADVAATNSAHCEQCMRRRPKAARFGGRRPLVSACTFGADKLQAKQVSAPEDCGV